MVGSLWNRLLGVLVLTPWLYCGCDSSPPDSPASIPGYYYIGNSLTWDSRPASGLADLLDAGGLSHETAYHIHSGATLHTIHEDPEGADADLLVDPYGNWSNSLPSFEWSTVSVQPYRGGTAEEEKLAAVSLIQSAMSNSANSDTVFSIYAAWPNLNDEEGFAEGWELSFSGDDGEEFLLASECLDWMYDAVGADLEIPSSQLHLIPVGYVMASLDERMRAGELDGFVNADDLYRDAYHLNNVGRYIASLTVYATVFATDPAGLPVPDSYTPNPEQFETDREITPALAAELQAEVWTVVTAMPRTGVSG